MPNDKKSVSLAEAIKFAIEDEMDQDPSVFVMGLGVNDPGRVFGTTQGLLEKYGRERVFETPTSENAVTGIAVGAALGGLRPVAVHQRLDFFLLAMDQLVNSAAKWHYMFGGQFSVPTVFRLILGRGWGQGPTHSQSLHSWLAHIPGLKVVFSSTPQNAYDLMRASIQDKNPVVFLEHRWLHGTQTKELVRHNSKLSLSDMAINLIKEGSDITLVSFGIGTHDCLGAEEKLNEMGYSADVIDIRLLNGDLKVMLESVAKTGKVLIVDHGLPKASYGSWLVSEVVLNGKSPAKLALMTFPDIPEATSRGLLDSYHPNRNSIFNKALELITNKTSEEYVPGPYLDVPDEKYRGPF